MYLVMRIKNRCNSYFLKPMILTFRLKKSIQKMQSVCCSVICEEKAVEQYANRVKSTIHTFSAIDDHVFSLILIFYNFHVWVGIIFYCLVLFVFYSIIWICLAKFSKERSGEDIQLYTTLCKSLQNAQVINDVISYTWICYDPSLRQSK